MLQRLRAFAAELVAVGILVSGVGGGFLAADNPDAWELREQILGNTTDDFDDAKVTLYNDIDSDSQGRITARYSGSVITLVDTGGVLHPDPTDGVQVEHTWASLAAWAPEEGHFERDSIPGADLHHLFAVRRGPNGSRGNHSFGELPTTARELAIDPDGTLEDADGTGTPTGSFRDTNAAGDVVFEPRRFHKGDAARAMFYMSVRYWMEIPEHMERDLKAWHISDPVTQAEQRRNDRIAQIQGNRNPFVDFPDLVEEIPDF